LETPKSQTKKSEDVASHKTKAPHRQQKMDFRAPVHLDRDESESQRSGGMRKGQAIYKRANNKGPIIMHQKKQELNLMADGDAAVIEPRQQ
jgi:hypothetical protein